MNKPVIVAHYICDGCKKPITDPKEGFNIQGNIMLANPNSGQGIIGNGKWISKVNTEERLIYDEIPETVLCKNCFCNKLGIVTYTTRSPINPTER